MSHSQKISSFNVSTSLNNSDLFTLVLNGTNKNISFSDFKLSLGVTGTINQAGDPLGAPILDNVSPAENNIRNIESGAGILANISAQNGVILKTNFIQDNTGAQLIKNLTDKQLLFKSLVAGDGITITENDNNITISLT